MAGIPGRGGAEAELWSGGERAISGTGALRINQHWWLAAPPAGVQSGPQFDVDLGALYELADGTRGVVQFLGGLRGAFERAPFIAHDRDDRAGSAVGENLFINLDRGAQIRRVLIFVYAHNGPLATAHVAVDFLPPGRSVPFRIALEHIPPDAHACAVALLTSAPGHWTARREVHYVRGFQSDLDRAYGFGLRWARQDKPGL